MNRSKMRFGLLVVVGLAASCASTQGKKATEAPPKETFYREAAAVGPEEVWGETVRKGLMRLDTPTLVRRAALFKKLVDGADPEQCRQLADGSVKGLQLDHAVERLAPVDRDDWFRISTEALRAELAQRPPPPAPELDSLQGFAAMGAACQLMGELMGVMGEMMGGLMGDPSQPVENSDVSCKALRKLLQTVETSSEPLKSVIVRGLFESEDGPRSNDDD